jgi:hypothetical protein
MRNMARKNQSNESRFRSQSSFDTFKFNNGKDAYAEDRAPLSPLPFPEKISKQHGQQSVWLGEEYTAKASS